MSELYMVIDGGLTLLADYDYDDNEKIVIVNAVYIDNTDIMDILHNEILETIMQNIFDSFDKELQEPDYEYIEG
jgi:hypothetical protein|tara:strand:+ start:838 stop:1059 length:222 start_codon:yes stop_codon:yes gene_type:complete